jgi:hypothetical protein
MPKDLFRWAPLRLLSSASILAMGLCAASAFAQGAAQPAVNDRQVQAFFNGIALDQQLAEQYASPAAPAPKAAAAAKPQPAPSAVAPDDAAAMQNLEAGIDAAIGQDDAEADSDERTTIADVPPSPVQTVMLVLASLALLAFAATVLTLAIRELKKDAKQRKRTYRRRVKRRDKATPAHAS